MPPHTPNKNLPRRIVGYERTSFKSMANMPKMFDPIKVFLNPIFVPIVVPSYDPSARPTGPITVDKVVRSIKLVLFLSHPNFSLKIKPTYPFSPSA